MDATNKEFDPLNVWSNSNATKIETITPHKVIVVFLVQEYLKIKFENGDRDNVYPAKYRRQFTMALLRLIQYPDLSYKDLHACLSSPHDGIDPRLLRNFETLMENVNQAGVDILFDLQIFISQLLTERDQIDVSQLSIVGFYVRRILLALNKMSFPDIIELYKSVRVYYDRGSRTVNILSADQGDSMVISNIGEDSSAILMEDITPLQQPRTPRSQPVSTPLSLLPTVVIPSKEKNGYSKWSVKQANLFILQQCNLLENDETRAMRPIELQQRLKDITQDIPFYTQAHILSYMNSLRIRDYFNAMDAFHSSYDRTATRGNTQTKLLNDQAQPIPVNSNNKGLQYSSLNLAILHVQFGHTQEALASLKECIMLAQEAGDRICLQLAQSWLCLLDCTYVLLCENSIGSDLENSAMQAVSLGVQFIVNVAAMSGVPPSKVFELLMRAEVINYQNNLQELVANSISQKAAIWQQYGKSELSLVLNQVLLQIQRTNKEGDCVENREGVCLALCNVALWLSLQGDINLTAVVLQHASDRFPRDSLSKHWLTTEALILSQHAIQRYKWSEAAKACSTLYLLDPVLGTIQRGHMYIARRHCVRAQGLLQPMLRNQNLEPTQRIRIQILLANTFLDQGGSDNDRTTIFNAELIRTLTEAAVYAKYKYLSYEGALVDIHTAYVLLLMGLPQLALRLVRNCMETIFANGGVYDCSRTQFLFVRCLVAAQHTIPEMVIKMKECIQILIDCAQTYLKLEIFPKAKDIYIYLATFYEQANMPKERNRWSYKFRDLEEQFPTSSEYLNVFQ